MKSKNNASEMKMKKSIISVKFKVIKNQYYVLHTVSLAITQNYLKQNLTKTTEQKKGKSSTTKQKVGKDERKKIK